MPRYGIWSLFKGCRKPRRGFEWLVTYSDLSLGRVTSEFQGESNRKETTRDKELIWRLLLSLGKNCAKEVTAMGK